MTEDGGTSRGASQRHRGEDHASRPRCRDRIRDREDMAGNAKRREAIEETREESNLSDLYQP